MSWNFWQYKLILLLFYCLFSGSLTAQESEFLDSYLEQFEEAESADADWIEDLWELKEHPLNLNQASEKDLSRIPFLSPGLVQDIIKLRKSGGQIERLDVLLSLDEMTPELLEALSLFVRLEKPRMPVSGIVRSKLVYDWPESRGFEDGNYQNPVYVQNRYLFTVGNYFSGGMIQEKDAGEHKYNDHLSSHILYQNPLKGLSVFAGDYQVKIGCGLLLWSPYGSPLSPQSIPQVKSSEEVLRGNRSSNEFHFLRGFAATREFAERFDLTVFYSHRKLDGSLNATTGNVEGFYSAGLHRTDTEVEKQGILTENLWGAGLQMNSDRLNLKVFAVSRNYQPAVKGVAGWQKHLSLSYSATSGTLLPAGELVLYQGKFPALQQSLFFNLKRLKYETVFYYYHPRYFSISGKSFASFYRIPQNRYGAATLLNSRLLESTSLYGYFHIYKNISDFQSNPFVYRDYYLELYRRIASGDMRFRLRQKYRESDIPVPGEYDKILTSLRFALSTRLTRSLRLQNRLELSWAEPLPRLNRYYGTTLYHQIDWNPKSVWRISARITSFDIPGFDLRMYEYEPDLPGSFRIVLLNDRGYKSFILLRITPVEYIQFHLKYQQRFYPDVMEMGSGHDKISANRVHEFKFSLVLKY